MTILDRAIMTRFLVNFVLLFLLLFTFAVAVDIILQVDEFVDVARRQAGPNAGFAQVVWQLTTIIATFHGPKLFQFYAFLLGLICVGAAGFTLAQMHRHRELVAIMASGISLHRVAMPIVAVAFALNIVQLLNQEMILPRLAPLLVRSHGDMAFAGLSGFPVPFTRDSRGALLQTPEFQQTTATMKRPTILERDEHGRTARRITADTAAWDAAAQIWRFTNGRAMFQPTDAERDAGQTSHVEPIDSWQSDLTPDVIILRRHAQYASLLSFARLDEMMRSPGVVDAGALARFKYARFSSVLINLLILAISLPFFLLREPASLVRQSLLCAAVTIPAMVGAMIGMSVKLADISPAVSVFLPIVILIPLAMGMVPQIKT